MLRRVAFKKAIVAGAAGASAWEIAVRLLAILELPLFDLVRLLGTMFVGDAPVWWWWPAALTAGSAGNGTR